MAYNPYAAVNAIYKLKGEWDNANTAGDDLKKNSAAKKAQEYYNQLRKNGYKDVADELTAANYSQAKSINDKWAKTGKTPTRDYLYSLGKGYGMSTTDVDNLIGWDNQTGEISFGGKKIGSPDSVVDGVSYFKDTSTLDNAFNDYVTRSGVSRPNTSAISQENENLFKKYNQEYEDLKNTNPFTTDEAKAILAKYDLAGLQGRDNEVASGAGSNGGNIDSFAAANALRQQTALVTQGQQVVLDAYQQKLDHAKSLLSDMGVNIDRVFNQDETAKNNQVSRDVATSEVTGVVPESMSYASNPFFNSDGTLKNEETDYQAIINNATEKLKTTTNSAEKANLEATIKYAKQARTYKVQNNPKYAKWADTLELWSPDETADYKLQNKQIDSAERIATNETDASLTATNAQLASAEKIAGIEAQSAVDQINATAKATGIKPTLTASQAATAIKNGETSQDVIDAYNYYYGTKYTTDNPPTLDGESSDWSDSSSDNGSEEEWNAFLKYFPETSDKEKKIVAFLNEQLKPYYDSGREINEEIIEQLIVGSNAKNSNSTKYDIDVDDAKSICDKLGLDSTWVNKYKNRWGFNSGKGMKSAE